MLQDAIPGVRLVNCGQLGDGNLHYNVQAPKAVMQLPFLREHEDQVNTLMFDSVHAFRGSISAEHGEDKLEQYKSLLALDMMRTIKRALDPGNLMHPGRVIWI